MINVTVKEWHRGAYKPFVYEFDNIQQVKVFIELCGQTGTIIDGVKRIA